MSMGAVEVMLIGFPDSRFSGAIFPALQDLVGRNVISVIDCRLFTRDPVGTVGYIELEDDGANEDVAALIALIEEDHRLLSDDDIEAIATDLPPGDSFAVLVFEHTWVKPFRDAVTGAGGFLLADVRIPGGSVDEIAGGSSGVFGPGELAEIRARLASRG